MSRTILLKKIRIVTAPQIFVVPKKRQQHRLVAVLFTLWYSTIGASLNNDQHNIVLFVNALLLRIPNVNTTPLKSPWLFTQWSFFGKNTEASSSTDSFCLNTDDRKIFAPKYQHRFVTRCDFVKLLPAISLIGVASPLHPVVAFEGGIGGLGKTKPSTGILLWNEESGPILQNSNTGQISAELNVAGQPVLISLTAPWPLLSAAGLEARNIATTESAFIQVIENYKPLTRENVATKLGFLEFLQFSVFSPQGKFGAYATPFDVKIKPSSFQVYTSPSAGASSNNLPTIIVSNVKFTTYTPGLRESERQVLVKAVNVFANHWVVLVTGATRQRFSEKPLSQWENILDSFDVVRAPISSSQR
jgi:hypothetical protein